MSNIFKPVTREQAKLRMALTGVSGGGKTLGALYTAFGLTGDWSRVALIDTERERARLYGGRTDLPEPVGAFMYAPLYPPYSTEKYIDYVRQAAEAVGPDGVVIVDSLSHAWSYEGGVLEYKDMISSLPGKNSYTAWNEAGRKQNEMINSILSTPCHIIVTMRSKMDYALQENDRGKMTPVKLGLAPIQRDDTEYEFDVVLSIGRDHIATASKDVTFLDDFGEVITPELGHRLRDWLLDGKEPEAFLCADCGKKIRTSARATAARRAEMTTERFGRALCEECTKAAIKAQKEEAHGGAIENAPENSQ